MKSWMYNFGAVIKRSGGALRILKKKTVEERSLDVKDEFRQVAHEERRSKWKEDCKSE